MIAYLSAIVCILGLVIFLIVKPSSDVKEIGRIMFFCGLLAFLLPFGEKLLRLLPN